MSANYISPISMDAISSLCTELVKNNSISKDDFSRYHVKRGLRNEDGTGVMAGLTRICSVEGYYILDGELVPKEGKLSYRGYDINQIVSNCQMENRFGFEEVIWLLLFGELPNENQLASLQQVNYRIQVSWDSECLPRASPTLSPASMPGTLYSLDQFIYSAV